MSVFYNGDQYKMMSPTISQKYECLDYDKCENLLTRRADEQRGYSYVIKTELFRWLLFFLIGFCTAIAGTFIEVGIELLSKLKYNNIRNLINNCSTLDCIAFPLLIWTCTNLALVAAGTALVVYVEPIASGSGVAGVKAYLNGINVRHFIHIRTLCVKLVSVICAIVGGLGVGKEGPMVHAGTIIGGGLSQGRSSLLNKEIKWMTYFREDSEKRDFAAAGAGTGISAAFAAPIGGVLFTLEETSSFWKQSHVVRTLFATLNGTFFLNLFMSLYIAKFGQLSANELLNLGKFNGSIPWHLVEVPIFMMIGVIGGVIGSLFNFLSYNLARLRLTITQRKIRFVIEATLVAFVSALMGLTIVYIDDECSPISPTPREWQLSGVRKDCSQGSFSTGSSLWLQTFQADIRAMFHSAPTEYSEKTIGIFLAMFFVLSILSNGLKISLGLFIPSLLIGASWGRLLGIAIYKTFPSVAWAADPGKYAILGACAQMSGIMRMTLSLTVITMETTGDLSFGLPLIIVVIVATAVGNLLFSNSIYDVILQLKKIPVLDSDPPPLTSDIVANDFMSQPVICFNIVHRVGDILDVLRETFHNGFPIKSKKGTFCGLILRSQIYVIVEFSYFLERGVNFDTINPDIFHTHFSRRHREMILNANDEARDMKVNFEPFMSQSTFTVPPTASLTKCYRLFRGLGLRHLVVVDDTYKVIGIITRIDLAKFHTWCNIWKCKMGLEELPIEN